MRKIIISITLMLLIIGTVSAIDYTTDTMNYWKYNGDYTDETTNHDLETFGETIFVDGILGQAFFEEGEGIGTQGDFNASGLKTLDSWFWVLENGSSTQEIYLEISSGDEFNLLITPETSTLWDYDINLYTDSGNCGFDSGSYPQFTSINDDEFNHFVFVINGTNFIIYINGVEEFNELCNATYTDDSATSNVDIFFTADNLILLSEAYTPADVTASYNGGSGTEFVLVAAPPPAPFSATGGSRRSTSSRETEVEVIEPIDEPEEKEGWEGFSDTQKLVVVALGGVVAYSIFTAKPKPRRIRRRRK